VQAYRVLLGRYRLLIGAFVLAQLIVLITASGSLLGQWFVVAGYATAALFAIGARALMTTVTSLSLVVLRALVVLKIGGLPLQAASMVFADLFFMLVIFESEYYRTFRRNGRRRLERVE